MTAQLEDRIVPPKAVIAKTSLSRTTLWRLSRSGDFPPPVRLSANRIGWSLSAIDAWLAQRAASEMEAA